MRLVINGRFLTQPVTGVQRVSIEAVTALEAMLAEGLMPDLDVQLVIPKNARLITEMQLKCIEQRAIGKWTGHAWEQLELPLHCWGSTLLCLGNTAPIAALLHPRTRVHTLVHDLSYRYFPQSYSRAFRILYGLIVPLALAMSTSIFTVSQAERRTLSQHYPRVMRRQTVTVVQNGGGEAAVNSLDCTTLRSAPNATETSQSRLRGGQVLYVGSLSRRKNADGLAAAANRFLAPDNRRLVVIGGTASTLKATNFPLDDNVRAKVVFRGQVNDLTEISDEYERSAVFVFPSYYEASPLPPIEAMARGCPVVAADIPSLRERCGSAALYCDPKRPEDIAAKVERLLNDEALWSDYHDRGLAQAASFSWRNQMMRIMHRVMEDAS